MADIVIREVTQDVWIFSKPFNRFGIVPVGGRSTAIKLSDGNVWVLASTPLSEETKATLDALGPVKYITTGSAEHTLYLPEFKKTYPDAKLIGMEPFLKHKELSKLEFAGVLGHDAEGTLYGFESDMQACYFSGCKTQGIAWFHPASKTLVEADLLFNLPANEAYSKVGSAKFPLIDNLEPNSWFHKKFISAFDGDTQAMKRDAKTVASWDFERIIPCHGDVIESDGKKAWEGTYNAFLE